MRRVWSTLLLAACVACQPTTKQKAPVRAAAEITEHFLGEWFAIPGGRCQVSGADSRIIESSSLPFPDARIRPDVRAVDVALQCENGQGTSLRSSDALPSDVLVLLQTIDGKRRAARPALAEDSRDHLVFELPESAEEQLQAVRRYDAQSGQSVVARERAVARLLLYNASRELHVQLRPRFRDARFDAAVDTLAKKLAQGEPMDATAGASEAGAQQLTDIYRDVMKRFRPSRLALLDAVEESEQLRLVLALLRPQRDMQNPEAARFELTLDKQTLALRSFVNGEEARTALTCGDLLAGLRRELAALESGQRGADFCNVLGTLVPGRCADLDDKVVTRALNAGLTCNGFSREEQRSKLALPPDFQITMRRGKSKGPLDKSPRYVLSLFDDGHVVFHGRHWVTSEERADGRTHRTLLSGVYERLTKLDWFDRRGGQFEAEHCIPSEDDGDVITVIARERQRMVLNRDRCRGPFSEAELTDLRRHIERVAGVVAWTEPRPSYVDRAVQEWAVAE